ncbi:M20 metallopeptidase family protein [Anaerococcus degeneri]|uniref:M20 family metallopeptidase n=1 Tax=Anaerococcus degeneri TaxID=361500 RepID=A0ABS7Z044_9FIRM|nr:M20 family metallopeptidase [Anaerococcus degeneri]MBP2015555.1 amidohydrolase [Anaerococcus degeneri]MCA2095911.1 M20 family metallopeptidase [Anaerococcus degeneri]
MTLVEKIKGEIKLNKYDIVNIRRYLHENPELSSMEFETSQYLKEKCEEFGFVVEDVPGSTGFTALLDTGRPGKTLGIRTDLDALAIEEDPYNLKEKKKVVSKNPGVSHACGHDSHMTIALMAGKILKDLADEIDGKIYFIFEEAEETGAGIGPMLDHLKDKGLDGVYGNHQSPSLDVGKFSIIEGPAYAGCAGVDFDVIGKGGHGSRPDKAVNPLIATAHIITALNSAWNNQLDLEKPVSLGIGAINGGQAANVICDRANVKGTLRFFDLEEGKKALDLVKNVADLTAKTHGCSVVFNDYTRIVAEPVINDENLAKQVKASLDSLFENPIVDSPKLWISESFYGYSKLCPSIFINFGTRNEEKGQASDLHTGKFDLDERGIDCGLGLAIKFAIDFLKESDK